jgi:hypothetical protein
MNANKAQTGVNARINLKKIACHGAVVRAGEVVS